MYNHRQELDQQPQIIGLRILNIDKKKKKKLSSIRTTQISIGEGKVPLLVNQRGKMHSIAILNNQIIRMKFDDALS
jgi:hypothetical protein